MKLVNVNVISQKYQANILEPDIRGVAEAVIFPLWGITFQQDKAPWINATLTIQTTMSQSYFGLVLLHIRNLTEIVWSYTGHQIKNTYITISTDCCVEIQ